MLVLMLRALRLGCETGWVAAPEPGARLHFGDHAVALCQPAPVLDLAPVFLVTLGATCLGKEVSMPCASGWPCLEHFEFLAAHGSTAMWIISVNVLHVVLCVSSSCIAGALETRPSQGRELDHGWQVLPHVA